MEIDDIKKAVQEGLRLKEEKYQNDLLEKERLAKEELEKELKRKNDAELSATSKIEELPKLIQKAILNNCNYVRIYIGNSILSDKVQAYNNYYVQCIENKLKDLNLKFSYEAEPEVEVLHDPFRESQYKSYWLYISVPFDI